MPLLAVSHLLPLNEGSRQENPIRLELSCSQISSALPGFPPGEIGRKILSVSCTHRHSFDTSGDQPRTVPLRIGSAGTTIVPHQSGILILVTALKKPTARLESDEAPATGNHWSQSPTLCGLPLFHSTLIRHPFRCILCCARPARISRWGARGFAHASNVLLAGAGNPSSSPAGAVL